jgi:hypothetical protein
LLKRYIRRKNYIQQLRNGQGWALNHDDKAHVIQEYFLDFMRHPPRWQVDINWEALQLPTHDLSELEVPFSEEEIKHAVHQMPSDKASGPDGYSGIFFKSCWDIIKEDVIKATNAFYSLQVGNLDILNSANVVLIPKTEGTESIPIFGLLA